MEGIGLCTCPYDSNKSCSGSDSGTQRGELLEIRMSQN